MATVATISVNFAQYDTTSFTPAGVIDRSINPRTLSQYCLGSSIADGSYIGGFVKKTGDTMSGPLTLPSMDPATDNQAARKLYVDSRVNSLSSTVSNLGAGGFVRITGSTMIGDLILNTSIPTITLQAASKGYVDTRIDSLSSTVNTRLTNDYLPRLGGTMAGNISMGSNRITGLPTTAASFSDSDAVSKKYVDDALSGGTSGVATKTYVDQQDNLRVLKTGDTMSGRLIQSVAGFGVATKETINTRTDSGFFQTSNPTTAQGWPVTTNGYYHLMASTHSNDNNYYSMQFAGDFYNSNELYYRATNGNGNTTWNQVWHSGNINPASVALASSKVSKTGDSMSGNLEIQNSGPTITFRDLENRTGYIHVNSDLMYFLGGPANQPWGQWNTYPLYLNLSNNLATFGGSINAAGNITASSDESLKENVETLSNSLDKVLKMRGVVFNRKDIPEEKDRKHIGVIAQEIEKILPEVVSENDKGLKGVAYGNIVAVLIEAIKELNDKVEKLESKS